MKVALTLLIVGVLLAAIGVGLWVESNNVISMYRDLFRLYKDYVDRKLVQGGVGAGLAVIGGSMAIGGIVMMIVRREDKSK